MIPYFTVPFDAFRVTVALAVAVCFTIFLRRGDRLGIPRQPAKSFFVTCVISAFLMAHMVKLTLYSPELLADPWRLFRIFDGLSSFGGILGAVLGGWLWTEVTRLPGSLTLRMTDAAFFAFPFGWTLGRIGCALAHDHVGRLSDHWLAVQYPGGARWNLGFLEALYTAGIAVLFCMLDRRPRAPWFYSGLLCLLYGPFRFLLDGLHESAPLLASGLTVDRACALAVTVIGPTYLLLSRHTVRVSPNGGAHESTQSSS
jgi:phosphatidylglycerol:prolipoprotein diacylglycerol transferase